ncbi:hypothetical protein ACWV27_13745 [Massilia varians]|jgi:hypothetical protein|uniref:Uncharacterized protein n=1 Tax=Massilia consociata TaxID=760117 RepID=A0ABV6FET0_9BURK|nr:hypothetical protein IM543_13145 [Massilia sp. UMI-21]
MSVPLRFASPTDNSRPHGSHRYDVFGPKIQRQLALFGRDALDAWTLLEADPDVVAYCERPLSLPDLKRKRVVDFWVCRKEREEFIFLLRPSELASRLDHPSSIPAFRAWAASSNVEPAFVDPDDIARQKLLLSNWESFLCDLSAFGRYVPKALSDQVLKALPSFKTLTELEQHFAEEDPVLLRVAVVSLLHQGRAICSTLGSETFSSRTVIEAKS